MSGGGATKRAAQQTALKTEEGQRSKEAAVRAVNQLFGTGDFRDQNPGRRFVKSVEGNTTKRGATIAPIAPEEDPLPYARGESPFAYKREKSAYEIERDANKRSREDLYAGNRNAVLDFNKDKLNRDLSESERQLRFSLGRSGLFAGSEDIAQRGKQRDAYDQGILQSTSLADQSAASFRGADERTRLDVINQIQGGADTGTALQNAQRGLELSAQSADANSKGNIIGNVFGDAGLIYDNQNRNQGTQDARNKYANPLGAYFNNNRNAYSGTRR